MPQHADTTRSRKRAVIYLRVSTPRQMQTDFDPLGISIPAQEEAARRKAAELDAEVVKVFIEPGRTATTIDKRPVFQEMLAFVKADKHIDYVIVYMFSRAFRNAVDAGVTKQDLRKLGTRLVATNLDLGEGPESDMIETILHAVDQYRSEADGADIAYKMGKKAQAGGTISAAKYGYRNVRVEVDGRKVATVHVEPTEAAYVKQAFELYATGKYSQRLLLDTLTDLGMRSRGNSRFGSHPLSVHKIGQILQDRYYLGYVTYNGVEYKGRHEAWIPSELFEWVQRILYSERGAGARQCVHNHYL